MVASIYDLGAISSVTVISRATWFRILWDKHMHGRNLGKNSQFKDDTCRGYLPRTIPPCSLCGGADFQYHIIRECSHRTMKACRQKHIALLNTRR